MILPKLYKVTSVALLEYLARVKTRSDAEFLAPPVPSRRLADSKRLD